ncbi:gamma-glutamyltransferase, partial [Mycobacterium tuberculosis]|nr:gamma-glutamyltransferase [Mycobacterium tuberculosis]
MRRTPHASTLLRAAALAVAPALILTACSSSSSEDTQARMTCGELHTGTQIDSSAAAQSSADISTRPEAATGYRTGMQPVQTRTYAAAT